MTRCEKILKFCCEDFSFKSKFRVSVLFSQSIYLGARSTSESLIDDIFPGPFFSTIVLPEKEYVISEVEYVISTLGLHDWEKAEDTTFSFEIEKKILEQKITRLIREKRK